MTKLENTLAAEIKRRITSQRQLERTCQEQISALEQRLMEKIERQSQHVTSMISSLEEQMQELQKQVDRVSKDIPKSMELQAQRVSQELTRLSQDVHQEKHDRFSREGLILKQIQDYESSISDMIERERDQRKAKVDFLREILERNESGRVEAESRFASLIESEIEGLKSQLLQEIQERQVEDDAIVDAMNLYITKLQSTLNVITADE
jgi:ATP-dependent Clp protease ATP-binding subunit ClpA